MATRTKPTQTSPALHLVIGDEELLAARAVSAITADVRGDEPHVDVERVRGTDMTAAELAELLSPSLFAEARLIVIEGAQDAGKDAAALITSVAEDLPDGFTVVVRHAGGAKGKATADALTRAGATVHRATGLKASELPDFVRAELRSAGATADADAVTEIIDAIGSSLRELAAACAQLVADTGARVDAAAVRRYHQGRAEVSGFDVADAAVAGHRAEALEALRWAGHRGVADVLLADALADAVRTVARVGAAGGGDPFQLAGRLGLPPWKVRKAQGQTRGWSPGAVGRALQVVATLNADVKGVSPEPGYAIERAVHAMIDLRTT